MSLRNLNQLWVLDATSHAIKWAYSGPMRGQHDPDFRSDGAITMFDNRAAGTATPENGMLGTLGGSRITAIAPATGKTSTIVGATAENPFC